MYTEMGYITVVRVALILLIVGVGELAEAEDTNQAFNPCSDTLVQKSDGFSFGIAFAAKDSFYANNVELSPCDSRLQLSSKVSHLAVFRAKVDEITLLSINTSTGSFSPEQYGGYMVVFAGHTYAARSIPRFVADQTHIITSFTLILDFKKGRLQNLFWKKDGCNSCQGKSSFVCYQQACAIKLSDCKSMGGSVDCSLGIQLAFSGTDKHDSVLNSWYEINKLRQYSLYGLYSNLKNSLTNQYSKIF